MNISNQWNPFLILGLAIATIVENIPVLKRMWEGLKTRKEDLEVDWEVLHEAERKL